MTEKIKDILVKLQYCNTSAGCDHCSLAEENDCVTLLHEETIELIIQLESELERLTVENRNLIHEKQSYIKYLSNMRKEKIAAENRLNELNEEKK